MVRGLPVEVEEVDDETAEDAVDEIADDVDNTKYNKYFTQAANAVPVRMAILKTLIENNPK